MVPLRATAPRGLGRAPIAMPRAPLILLRRARPSAPGAASPPLLPPPTSTASSSAPSPPSPRRPPLAPPADRRPLAAPPAASSSSAAAGGGSSLDGGGGANMPLVLACVGVACAGAFAFGYHLGVVNGPLGAIAAELGFAGDAALQGLVVSSTLAGAAAGSLGGGALADRLGRRGSFLLCALPMLVGPLLSAAATSLETMVAGRAIAGLAIGLSSALVPVYIAEVAPTAQRGTFGALNQLLICLGILAALLVNVALDPAAQWRAMFAIAAAPAVVLFAGMAAFCPESPVFLARAGRADEAAAAARRLWGPSGPSQLPAPAAAAKDAAPSSASTAPTPSSPSSPSSIFSPAFRKGVLLGCALFVFQQLSGINAIIYFSSSVFKEAGIRSGALASAAVGACNVAGTLVATFAIERAGRKQLLVASYLGMVAAMAAMSAGFALPALAAHAGAVALGGTLLYILAFAVGAGPVTGLIVPELNAAAVRGQAVSAAMVTHWVANVLVGQNFLPCVDRFGVGSVYAGFGAFALLGAAFVARCVPETRGKSFDAIQRELQ
jgi:sugar porter (SP) family MFS transporter